ncbi:MAG: diguanylate cyclase, partial [Lachnospiraceae bacterium]|nr:diguanylate cyclase [Lachnospiraceae bacterium]
MYTHYLTGLPNAGGYMKYVGELYEAGRIKEFSAFYINIKRFGLIARRFGMEESDRIICRYAGSLSDFIEEDECIGHLGGDNFTALIKKDRTEAFLDHIAEISTYGQLRDRENRIKLNSVAGVWEIDDHITDPGQIIGFPAVAIGVAKNVTHAPYMYVTPQMITQIDRQKMIEED